MLNIVSMNDKKRSSRVERVRFSDTMTLGPSQRETRGGREEREQEASRARNGIARRASKVRITRAVVIEDARVQGEVNLYESTVCASVVAFEQSLSVDCPEKTVALGHVQSVSMDLLCLKVHG